MTQTPRSPRGAHARRGTAARLAIALALIGAASVAWFSRHRILHGSVAPPAVDAEHMEPALARRLEERTAAVRAEPYSAEAWGMLGAAYDVHDLFDEGIFCYERAAELDPDDFRWPYFVGLATRLGDREASLAHLRRAAELRPSHAPIFHFIGDALLGSDDLDGAEQAFERACELDPQLVPSRLGLAKVALARAEHEKALEHLRAALALGPQTGEVHSLFVEAYRLAGDREKMDEHARLETAELGFEPVDDPVRFQLEWTERVTLRWRNERAERHLREGRPERAVEELRAAVRDDPGSFDARLALGGVLFRAGLGEQAAQEYRRAIELAPDDARGHLGAGAVSMQLGRLDEAIAALERALELDPKLHQARNNLGALLVQRGELERGLELLRESCAGLPNDRDAHLNWARALKEAGRAAEAERVYATVAAIDPEYTRALFARALDLARQGRFEEAAAGFAAVVDGAPERPEAHESLARALAASGAAARAVVACRVGLLHAPDDPGLRLRLAWILATSTDDGVRDGGESLELALGLVGERPRDPERLHVLAAACAETGDRDSAIRHARAALSELARMRADPRAMELRAELERALARYEAGEPLRE